MAAGVTGLTVGLWIGRSFWTRPHGLLRLRLRLLSTMCRRFVLSNVSVPVALLPPSTRSQLPAADDEGLVQCTVGIESGCICEVTSPESSAAWAIDGHGALLMACFTDAHTHLMKTHTHPRTRNLTGSISDALTVELDDQPRWAACACCRPIAFGGGGAADVDPATSPCQKATDLLRRMDFALATAYHHGTRAIRTHLDGTNHPSDAKLRATVYAAYDTCRAKWSSLGLHIVTSKTPIPRASPCQSPLLCAAAHASFCRVLYVRASPPDSKVWLTCTCHCGAMKLWLAGMWQRQLCTRASSWAPIVAT